MNSIGIVAALTAFLGIWIGHVAVRKIEFTSSVLELPMAIFLLAGAGLEYLSLISHGSTLSAVFGISGIILLWDALELLRQQRRVRRGHAPSNPANPRHMRILGSR